MLSFLSFYALTVVLFLSVLVVLKVDYALGKAMREGVQTLTRALRRTR